MSLSKLKKGDNVKILTGKDKGKTAKVLEVSGKSGKVMVEGVSMVSKHNRPKKSGQKGQIIVKPAMVNPANVMLVCSNCGKPSRISILTAENGEKSRMCKQCNRSV